MSSEDQMRVKTIWWEEDASGAAVCILDQSQLPQQEVYLTLRHEREVADAIRTLKVRGAPLIGVSAAYGMALALHRFVYAGNGSLNAHAMREHLREVGSMLASTRPTAVNLFWAIERMQRCADQAMSRSDIPQLAPEELAHLLYSEARLIDEEEVASCLSIGRYGETLIADGDVLLTHCNAGMLATVGLGTALAPLYTAFENGKRIHVFVDETRPILQGARLTAWELQKMGVPLTLITDNMAGYFMKHGGIKAVFVGADRIAANGDVANKIGTYGVALLAHAHHIPFYVVAPCSTVDLTLASGDAIPIEQRNPAEITQVQGRQIAPVGVQVANPAFDVTPHIYISGIITERGIARAPFDVTLRSQMESRYIERAS